MAIQATSEEQLRLRKRARQRLLGAGALLLTAAIVLPMVLDQSPRQPNQDVVIDMGVTAPSDFAIPSQPTPIQDTPSVVPPAVAAKSTVMPAESKAESAAEAVTVVPTVKNKPHTDVATPSIKTTPPAPVQVTVKSPLVDVPKTVTKPDVKTEPNVELKPKTVTTTHDEKTTHNQHFVVQLGAFSNAENVQQLRDRLSAVGVSTYTEKLSSGATRVRVGPFSDKAEAEKVHAKIDAAGVQAQVVLLK